ncbi:MAG: hypothetical protein NTW61_06530 [Candidatus Melainabacteria bacterium]|nr:hypothetical protein [Candidatus Melainabacteria bacterium]
MMTITTTAFPTELNPISLTNLAKNTVAYRSGTTDIPSDNSLTSNSNTPSKDWLPFEATSLPSSLVVASTEYFSSNPALDNTEGWVGNLIAWSNLFSSDAAKVGLNAWRQGLVDITRRLDYAWRSASQVPMQYIQEIVRRTTRSEIAPLFTAELFPRGNGYRLEEADRTLYNHLSTQQFAALKAFDNKYCFDVEKMGDLSTALLDDSSGLRYTQIPDLLSYFTCELETKDPTTGKGTGQYETFSFRPNSALATHLKWKLAAEDTLAEQIKHFDLLHPAAQHVPYLNYGAKSEHHIREVGQLVLNATNHVKQVGVFNQLPTVYQFLIQASRGDFTLVGEANGKETNQLNLPLAFNVFASNLHKEPWDEELPMILGGQGSSLKKLDQLVLKTWLGGLYHACEPEDETLAKASKFGQPSPFEATWKALWRDLKQGVDDPTLPVFQQRIGRAVERILSGKILLQGVDEIETRTTYAFKVDAEDKYGLKSVSGKAFIEESAQALWHLQDTVKQCHQLVTNQGDYKDLSPEAFQQAAASLLNTYYEHSFDLAATFPGKDGKELDALKSLITFNKQAALGNGNEEAVGAYNLLKLVNESRHLRERRLTSIVKASSIPQLVATVTAGLIATGVVWNYLDNNVIQKYENDTVEKKGSVEYTDLIMVAGFVPAVLAFVGMMKMDFFKKITNNRPHLHFGLVGAIALALQTVLTVGLVRAFIATRPDMPKLKPHNTPGTFTAKTELNLANVGSLFSAGKPPQEGGVSLQPASPFVSNNSRDAKPNPAATSAWHHIIQTQAPSLTASALEKQYPYTTEALKYTIED